MARRALTFAEAKEMLSLKDSKTLVKYGKEGRIRIAGTGNGQRVDSLSIEEYLSGESRWHKERARPVTNAGQSMVAPVRRSRLRRKPNNELSPDAIVEFPRRKKPRIGGDTAPPEPITSLPKRKHPRIGGGSETDMASLVPRVKKPRI